MVTARLTLTKRIYTHNALQQTATAYAHLCTTIITDIDGEQTIELSGADAGVADEFLNHALLLSAQELLNE